MNTSPFVIERTYDAPVTAVWQALTDSKNMKEWYFPIADFEPVVGFEFSFVGGSPEKQYVHLCRVTEVVPGKKMAYSWRYKDYPGESELSFELFDEGGKTRLKLTHAGLHTFPQDSKDFARDSFMQGWTYIVGTSLAGYLEKAKG